MIPRPTDEELKMQVNNFLFCRLPPTTTLAEMETLAVNTFFSIRQKWDEWETAQNKGSIPMMVEAAKR